MPVVIESRGETRPDVAAPAARCETARRAGGIDLVLIDLTRVRPAAEYEIRRVLRASPDVRQVAIARRTCSILLPHGAAPRLTTALTRRGLPIAVLTVAIADKAAGEQRRQGARPHKNLLPSCTATAAPPVFRVPSGEPGTCPARRGRSTPIKLIVVTATPDSDR